MTSKTAPTAIPRDRRGESARVAVARIRTDKPTAKPWGRSPTGHRRTPMYRDVQLHPQRYNAGAGWSSDAGLGRRPPLDHPEPRGRLPRFVCDRGPRAELPRVHRGPRSGDHRVHSPPTGRGAAPGGSGNLRHAGGRRRGTPQGGGRASDVSAPGGGNPPQHRDEEPSGPATGMRGSLPDATAIHLRVPLHDLGVADPVNVLPHLELVLLLELLEHLAGCGIALEFHDR